jgi:hypothetical protein
MDSANSLSVVYKFVDNDLSKIYDILYRTKIVVDNWQAWLPTKKPGADHE